MVGSAHPQPVAALYAHHYGQPMLETLPVNALLAGNAEDWGEIASTVVAKGWKTLKLKAPADVDAALTMVAQVREWVGKNVALRLDVNAAWNEESARRFLAQAQAAQLEYLEQPLAADELAATGRLQTLAPIPIALDESIRNASDVAQAALPSWTSCHPQADAPRRLARNPASRDAGPTASDGCGD